MSAVTNYINSNPCLPCLRGQWVAQGLAVASAMRSLPSSSVMHLGMTTHSD